ncbi:MAG: hypothetical protein KJT01_17040 [Gemmatimonadetes bacterium]|nr:hypothetical protein [Gemmatimonadota bacterium]
MAKLKIWRAGERSEALCERCRGWRDTEFQYRTVPLAASRKRVDDVLVGVCLACDGIASIPQQSAARLRAIAAAAGA